MSRKIIKSAKTEAVMKRLRTAFEGSGKKLQEIGEGMGYEGVGASHSVWQLLHRATDPRLSMLMRFAEAVGTPIEELIAERK